MTYNYFVELGNVFFITFIIGHVLHSMIDSILEWLNSDKHDIKDKIKKIHSFSDISKKLFSTSKINKSMEYKRVSDGFDSFMSSLTSSTSVMVVMFGITPFILHTSMCYFPNISLVWHMIAINFVISLLGTISNIPFSYYYNFKIEKDYGFNKMTKGIFFGDIIKSFLISTVMTSLFIYVINFVLTSFGKFNLTMVGIFIVGAFLASMLLEYIHTKIIMYWFNDFKPLKRGRLYDKLNRLLKKYGYSIEKVLVMDGSKRSTKSNAFIGGLFGSKRIVLFDNLLKTHNEDEICSIIGHELAHGKLNHLSICRAISIITTSIAFMITFGFFIYNPSIYNAFGYTWINETNVMEYGVIGLMLSMMIISSVSWIFDPIGSFISRKMEYAADRYSIKYTGNKKAMINSLLRLSSENLSDLFPNKYYEMWYYSHPGIINRIEALKGLKLNVNNKTQLKKTEKIND